MMQFDFHCEWQEGPKEVRHPAHRATWAHLQMGANGQWFTANAPLDSDDESAEARDFIEVSVFPLAEFIAANWWPLLNEPQEKEKLLLDTSAFKQRHWINRHTDGFAYPTLGFFGADSSVRVVARPSHIESANIEFPVSSGSTSALWNGVERQEVESALLNFLAATADRLPVNGNKAWLQDLLERIRHARSDQDEALYCRCAGLLGADPFELGDTLYTAITQTVAIVGQDIALEIFAVAEAPHVVQRAQWLHDQAQGAIKKSREVAKHASALKQSVRTACAQDGKPWVRGYAVAQQLRALLNLTPDMPMQHDEAVTQALFGAPAAVVSSIKDLELNSGARGVISQGSEGLGIAMPGKSGPLSQSQFQLAASFADFVFSGDSEIYLSTAAATDRQKANRAFAAEFLAPIQGIQEKWSSKKTPHTNVESIADAFGVSPYHIRYQVQNQADELLTL